MKIKSIVTVLFAALATQSLFGHAIATPPEEKLDKKYKRAVRDSRLVDADENVDTLTAITPDNDQLIWNADKTKLLVVTWKSQSSYERFLKPNTQTSTNPAFVTWVTAAPHIQEFCQDFLKQKPDATLEEINLRLKQHLGLHHSWTYDVFVEMWVSPEELFRPCVDPDITDTQCDTQFKDPVPVVKNIPDYPAFYKDLYFQDFRERPGVPWTGLGYTYDWHNKRTEVGASEFILVPEATYEITRATPTLSYCQRQST